VYLTVSNVCTVGLCIWQFKQQALLKRRSISTRLQGLIWQKTVIFLLATIRIWNLTCNMCFSLTAVYGPYGINEPIGNIAVELLSLSLLPPLHFLTAPLSRQAGFWHATYHLQPSIYKASVQNLRMAATVLVETLTDLKHSTLLNTKTEVIH
jgi:hypothetical protein